MVIHSAPNIIRVQKKNPGSIWGHLKQFSHGATKIPKLVNWVGHRPSTKNLFEFRVLQGVPTQTWWIDPQMAGLNFQISLKDGSVED